MNRNTLRNLFALLLIVLALYLLDNTRLKKYIGYNKVREEIKKDINIFGLAKGFFGNELLKLYNVTPNVSTNVISQEKYGDGYIVYQTDVMLYSTFLGSVTKIENNGGLYTVVISRDDGNVLYSNLKMIYVKLYQKIEADTLIGIIDGYYYYEKI
jgi:hypothetical protein